MKTINTYIIEKLKVDKDVDGKREFQSIVYSSSFFNRPKDLEQDIKNKTYIDEISIYQEESHGIMNNFAIYVYNKKDFLELIVYIYNRLAPPHAHINDELDNWLKRGIKGYTKTVKKIIHDTFTKEEIYDEQVNYMSRQ